MREASAKPIMCPLLERFEVERLGCDGDVTDAGSLCDVAVVPQKNRRTRVKFERSRGGGAA